MDMRRKAAAVFAGALLISAMAAPGVAMAGPSEVRKSDEGGAALAPCIKLAAKQRASQWVCTAEGLTAITRSPAGQVITAFTAVAPAAGRAEGSGVGVLADDYDTWCETGSICRRKINNYAAETKGNAAYGNTSGVIGSYDVVLRTNLNGRQAQWRATLIWDSGPTLDFNDTYVNCYEERNNLPDANCGDHYVGGPVIGPSGWRWDSGTVYGNRLVNSNEYYADVNTLFTPSGYPTYIAAPLRSQQFNCYGTSNCVFP
ncbi:hypothetical protein [Micromonospora sp. SH-82]|uniref:hypothetical protein n=1 Tax=Micromonospora sp. SH-82 TaxID=3132938 RepID=UPI003EBC6028